MRRLVGIAANFWMSFAERHMFVVLCHQESQPNKKNASLPYIAAFQLAELLPESFGPLDLHLHDDSELFRSQGITTSRCLLKL